MDKTFAEGGQYREIRESFHPRKFPDIYGTVFVLHAMYTVTYILYIVQWIGCRTVYWQYCWQVKRSFYSESSAMISVMIMLHIQCACTCTCTVHVQ